MVGTNKYFSVFPFEEYLVTMYTLPPTFTPPNRSNMPFLSIFFITNACKSALTEPRGSIVSNVISFIPNFDKFEFFRLPTSKSLGSWLFL